MTVTNATPAVRKFCEIWKDSFAAVLTQLGAASPSASVIGQPAPPAASATDSGTGVTVRFSCGGSLRGDLFCIVERPVAVQFAQLLMSEPLDAAASFNESHIDAFAEFLRQVSGLVATEWKQETGSPTELNFQSGPLPALVSPLSAALRLSADKFPEVALSLLLGQELCETLSNPPAPEPEIVESPAVQEVSTEPSPVAQQTSTAPELLPSHEAPQPSLAATPSNLDLLLDVELEATIRFGRHEMLLRDIFGLMPGAVVELDQMVNEPAELLVAGRLVARGEVVVVDGNFGIQVTQVASARQRAEIIQA